MLGAGLGVTRYTLIGGIDSPLDVEGCVAWWDFTDASTMYTDAGSTNVSSDGDYIYRIDNKAYTLQGNTTAAYGKFLENSVYNLQPIYKTTDSTTAKRPPNESGSNPISYGWFDERDFTTGGGDDLTNGRYLVAHRTLGNVSTGNLTETEHRHDKFTMFKVFRVVSHSNASANAGAVPREHLLTMRGYDPEYSGILPYLFSRQWTVFRPFSVDPYDTGESGVSIYTQNMQSDSLRAHNWSMSEESAANQHNDKFQFWTVKVDGGEATTTSDPYLRPGRFYRNGVSSAGIDSGTYTDIPHTADDDTSSGPSRDGWDGSSDWGYTTNKLNIGPYHIGTDSTVPFKPIQIILGEGGNDVGGFDGSYSIDFQGLSRLTDTYVYESIYYSRALSDEEITGVENYLKNKYGDPTTL